MKEIGMHVRFLGVGVDRIDYTKGIPSDSSPLSGFSRNIRSISGNLPLSNLLRRAAPTSNDTAILLLRSMSWSNESTGVPEEMVAADHLSQANHSHDEVYRYYGAADICMVTSLHDGMNLVAKEYVASRTDSDGS